MADEKVFVEWGPFMSSCYISLSENGKPGITLHIADDILSDNKADIPRLLSGLAGSDTEEMPLADVLPHLPPKETIVWDDEVKGDVFLGYELRGKADGYRAWVQTFVKEHPSESEKDALQATLIEARNKFFP